MEEKTMDFALTPELEMIRKTALDFANNEMLPYEKENEENDGLPEETIRKIYAKAQEAGFIAVSMPEEVGGGGFGTLAEVLTIEAITSVVSGAMYWLLPNPSAILLACNEDQKKRYLTPAINCEKHECFALTEPEAGSDAGNIKTTAVKKGDKWILNGTKRFISHANTADFAIVFAISDSETRAATCFLVDRGTPGYSIGQTHQTMGYRGYHQAELVFEDCEVPEANILGEVHKGWDLSNRWLRAGRLLTAAESLGQSARAIKLAREYAVQRVQFGQPVGDFQAIQFMLAECAADLYAARWMTYKTAWEEEHSKDNKAMNEMISMCKYFATEAHGRIVDKCLQIHGGMGYMKESPIEMLYRDARIERIWEGTSQIQLRIIGGGLRKRGVLHF
jgi:alkylation response protein AidB-like acyl-CoA dehydrogenase